MLKVSLFIIAVGLGCLIASMMSINKNKTSTVYAILITSFLILFFGTILITKKEFIPSNSIHIIIALLGFFMFTLGYLQRQEVYKINLIDKKTQDSLIRMTNIIMFLSILMILGAIYYYYNMLENEDYNSKVVYSIQKLKKIKKEREAIANKQKELEIESKKEIENIKLENKELGAALLNEPEKSPPHSPAIRSPRLKQDTPPEEIPKYHISQILKTDTIENVNLKSKDEANDKELQIHSTSIEPDKIILQKRHPQTPQTPRNSSSDDISDDELDFLMKKLKNT
jgi:ABC-type multidrug transport system fused ATPase/permease subunit